MQLTTRRQFLRQSFLAGLVLGSPPLTHHLSSLAASSPNDEIQVGVVGLGGIETPGGVGGRGRQLIGYLRQIPGVRITALCDVDETILDHSLRQFKDRGEEVKGYRDLRRLLDDQNIQTIAVATPNHWHGLATVWGCQAGKDVYVEKPFSQNIWEGRQMVAAARKYGRIVQVGTQSRSSSALRQGFEQVRAGQIGAIRFAHALVYRPRESIGTVLSPTPVPATVDYDLWCGPAAKTPLMRRQLHYEWHWFWATGNGEMGNNGIHVTDVCRWGLGQHRPPPRALSIGGRFAFADGGETPNTQVVILDYQPAPILCELRNVRQTPGSDSGGKYRGRNGGVVIDCEDGFLAGDSSRVALHDPAGKLIREFKAEAAPDALEVAHLSNFFAAVRSRRRDGLAAEAAEGHLSVTCCHMANISHRIGQAARPEAIEEAIRGRPEWADAFARSREHLRQNGVDLGQTPAVLGPWVTLDPVTDRFVEGFAEQANRLAGREYRPPFVVPSLS